VADNDANSKSRFPMLSSLRASQTQLYEDFEGIIRAARQAGIEDPRGLIDTYIDNHSLNDVKLFGLKAGIVFTFISPIALYGLKYHCAATGIHLDLPESAIMDFCLLNAGSVMSFGFGSAIHSAIQAFKKPCRHEDHIKLEDA
jgi:hypothetical protein